MSHDPLPVHGYTAQTALAVDLVNQNKIAEEDILRMLDEYAKREDVDKRWLAIGRTHLEQAFMAINRAIFRPQRIKIPGDPA